MIALTEQQQALKKECDDKLRRSTTNRSEVKIEQGPPLGDLKQYKVTALAYIHDTRALPPATKRLQAENGTYVSPAREVAQVTHQDLTIALEMMRDIIQ